jgi:hypothetical protein
MCQQCIRELKKKNPADPAIVILVNALNSFKCPAMKALEDLTPSGSEFYEDPQRCYTYARWRLDNQFNLLKNKMIEIKGLKAQLQASHQDDELALIGRTCKHCGKQFNGTAFGLCSNCGRFQ